MRLIFWERGAEVSAEEDNKTTGEDKQNRIKLTHVNNPLRIDHQDL